MMNIGLGSEGLGSGVMKTVFRGVKIREAVIFSEYLEGITFQSVLEDVGMRCGDGDVWSLGCVTQLMNRFTVPSMEFVQQLLGRFIEARRMVTV